MHRLGYRAYSDYSGYRIKKLRRVTYRQKAQCEELTSCFCVFYLKRAIDQVGKQCAEHHLGIAN